MHVMYGLSNAGYLRSILGACAGAYFVCPSTCLDGSPVPAGFAALVDGMVVIDATARLSAPEAAAQFAALPSS